MSTIYWMIGFLVFLGIEALTVSLTSIWFAGGALAALIASILKLSVRGQLLIFVLVSFLLLILVRPLSYAYVKRKKTATNVDGLIGKQVVVKEQIDNKAGKGTVTLEDQTWLARSVGENQVIAAGTVVEITAVSGAKLLVKTAV